MVACQARFRPLARGIGLYLNDVIENPAEQLGIPSPLEADRFISKPKLLERE